MKGVLWRVAKRLSFIEEARFLKVILTTLVTLNPSHSSSTAKSFAYCPSLRNPPVQQIGNYSLADLTSLYTKYNRRRTKHMLL